MAFYLIFNINFFVFQAKYFTFVVLIPPKKLFAVSGTQVERTMNG